MIKRTFDVVLSIGVLLLLGPILLCIALWVWLDSHEPIFFRQVRVGRLGREFRIYKFRTMRTNTGPAGPQITIGADPRITGSGRILRKYKIDELPQFINVLLGDMSVVGPRPEIPHYVALYPPAISEIVLGVRPGITDLASIEFRNENDLLGASIDPERTYVEEIIPVKLRYCVQYASRRSLWLDLRIIWKTILVVLG